MKKIFVLLFLCLISFTFYGCNNPIPNPDNTNTGQRLAMVDDWQYDASKMMDEENRTYSAMPTAINQSVGAQKMMAADSIGFATGGAKDVGNFRENIKNNYLPLLTDISYEGLFYDYMFDLGTPKETCTKLFCPIYSTAISEDPISGKQEYYMTVGLDSGMKESDFSRKKLNLVIVLDISGSMGSAFDKYYYDSFGNQKELLGDEIETKAKIEVAKESIIGLLSHLNKEDSFGIVLYDDQAYLGKKISKVGDLNMEKITSHIKEIREQGGTNMESGIEMATNLFKEVKNNNPNEYENRIIFLTDAQPNTGDTSESGLFGMTKKNAENKIYTTFIGIGVDFNTELVNEMTKVKGANYYAVHSSKEFKTRMDDEFDYMVTPLVFNLKLNLESTGYEIEKVLGSPEADQATGELMKINTLFPSKKEDTSVKGGIVLVKLKKKTENADLNLKVSYEDRNGKADSLVSKINFRNTGVDYFDNAGIQKGILLTRYVNLIKDWIYDSRKNQDKPMYKCGKCLVNTEDGIILPPDIIQLGQWERQSMKLQVSSEYKELFKKFAEYFKDEMTHLGDKDLEKEMGVLEGLGK